MCLNLFSVYGDFPKFIWHTHLINSSDDGTIDMLYANSIRVDRFTRHREKKNKTKESTSPAKKKQESKRKNHNK